MPNCSKFSSWSSAASYLRELILAGSIKHLTVDVFDTLLLRLTTPETVIGSTCRFVASRTGTTETQARLARDQAWADECRAAVEGGRDPDMPVDVLFSKWLARLTEVGIAGPLAQQALEHEMEAEAACLAPNGDMLDLIRTARDRGVRVTAVSDMYLSPALVSGLLARHGFEGLVSEVITSGNEGYQKRTGRLFDVLLRRWEGGVGICHVGDDSLADGRMPSSRGIMSVVVYDRRNMLHRQRVRGMRSRREREAYLASLHDWVPQSPAHDVGYRRFGPVYTAFAQAVAARAVADGIHSVWFMAREGWLLHEVYELVRRRSSIPPSGYLYVSRVAAMRAQLSEFGEREMASVHSDTWSRSFRSTLSPLQLTPGELHALLSPAGVGPDDSVTPERFARLAASESFRKVVERIGDEERKGLKAYLSRTGFPMSGRVAIVDVGWGGQIQENFSRALSMMGIKTEIVGYYLGTDDRAEQRRKDGLQLHGLLVDRANNDGTGLGAFSFVQGIEIATRSPHGSVRGYDSEGNPRLADAAESGRCAERADDPLIARMQEGIISYATRYLSISRITGASIGSGLELARDVLDVLATCPARDEARLLSRMKNVANLGMDETLGLAAEVSLRHPLPALRVLRNALWKEGTGAIILPFAGPSAILLFRRIKGLLPLRHGKPGGWEAGETPGAYPSGETDGEAPVVSDSLDLRLAEQRSALAVSADGAGASPLRCSFALDLLKLAIVRLLHGAGIRPVIALAKDTAASDIRYLIQRAAADLRAFRR